MVLAAAAFVGQFMGIAAWLVDAHIQFDAINTTTLQQIGPALAGGCFSLFISLILTIVLSLIFPQNYDWNDMKQILVFNDVSKDVSVWGLHICSVHPSSPAPPPMPHCDEHHVISMHAACD